jgi:hypothetical protein
MAKIMVSDHNKTPLGQKVMVECLCRPKSQR